jgi:hypothetical protein
LTIEKCLPKQQGLLQLAPSFVDRKSVKKHHFFYPMQGKAASDRTLCFSLEIQMKKYIKDKNII